MFRCDKCGWTSPTITVRCKGVSCGQIGSMRAVVADSTLKAAGGGASGLPVFTYEVGAGMTLTYIDHLA